MEHMGWPIRCVFALNGLVKGLSVADKLIINARRDDDAHIVIVLFELETTEEGHWLVPNPDLPTSVNDCAISCPVLLSQGTSISVGDRFLEYKYPIPRANLEDISKTGAPPKPRRISCEEAVDETRPLIETTEIVTSTGDMMFSIENELTKSQAIEVKQRLEIAPRGSVDDDLLSQITNRDQTEASSIHETVYRTFLSDFKALSDELGTAGTNHSIREPPQHHDAGSRPLQCELHDPVIVLLTEMLRITPFPMEHVIIWLTLLRTFSHFLTNINVFIREKTAAVVMGCMSAHSEDPAVQQQSCGVLAQLALYIPVTDEKGPIRESGVELIVRAMREHLSQLFVLRPACCALANLTMTYANFTNRILDNIASEAEEEERGVVRAMMILEYIRERALTIAYEVHKMFPSDRVIHTETRKVIAFFTELVPPPAAIAEEPDIEAYNIRTVRRPGAEDPEHPIIQITVGADSTTDESIHDDLLNKAERDNASPSCERRVQFAEQIEDWSYDASITSDGKCARWLGLESSKDNNPNMKSLFDELVEAEQANADEVVLDGDDLEKKKDAVASKLGLAGVVKGYFKKLKHQISSKDEMEQSDESCNGTNNNFTPVVEYTEAPTSTSSTSSCRSDTDSDMTSSQEWNQIQSGVYCKVDKSDSLPRKDIRPLSPEAGRQSSLYIPRYRKKGQEEGGSLQDLRTQETHIEKRLYPKGILKNSNLNLNLETQSEGGDSDFDACVRANTDTSDTLDDFDAPVLYAVPTKDPNINIVITAPDNDTPPGEDEDGLSFSDVESVASDIGDVIERSNMEDIEEQGVTNLKKKFSKSEPALNEACPEAPKRRKSSVVADKVKRYMDKIKDASGPASSHRRFNLPGKAKKYDLQKQFPSKFGNDEFIMKPNYHLRESADVRVNPLPEHPEDTHQRKHRGWSVTSSDECLDGISNDITITVLDTSSPAVVPRMAKRHSIAVLSPTGPTSPAKSEEFIPLPSKTKASPGRKKGVAGALKSYAQKFQRRKSEADITNKNSVEIENAEASNKNNNNQSKDIPRASSACNLPKTQIRSPNLKKPRQSVARSTLDLNQQAKPEYDLEDLVDDDKLKTILPKRHQAIQHFISLVDIDSEITVTNLAIITKAAMASAGLPCRDDHDFGLLLTDPSLGMSVYEICVR
ncbi:hypothetical protein CAPTEDRAFT_199471, partial [Capitella teleta]